MTNVEFIMFTLRENVKIGKVKRDGYLNERDVHFTRYTIHTTHTMRHEWTVRVSLSHTDLYLVDRQAGSDSPSHSNVRNNGNK
jgi:hypothetical protein